MANGKPLDMAYTDIVVHGMNVFGDEIDDLIRKIHRRWGSQLEVEEVAWENDPRRQNDACDHERVLADITAIRDRLEASSDE